MHLHFRQEKWLYTAECGNRIMLSGHFGVTVMLRVANRRAKEPGSPKRFPGVAGSTMEGTEIWQCHSHGRRAILWMEVLYGYIKYIWMWVQVLYMPCSAYSKVEIIIFYPVITHAVIWREMLRRLFLSQVFRISSNSLGAFETNLLLKK